MKLLKNLFKSGESRELDRLISVYRARLQRGEPLSREEFIADYPFLAIDLVRALDADTEIAKLENLTRQRRPSGSIHKVIDIDDDESDEPEVDTIRSIGMQIDDYDVIRELGRGAMGRVYKAYQKSKDRHVAIKTLQPGLNIKQSQMKRLSREAQAQGILKHPNIVELYDMGSVDGVPYLVMELIESGTSLDTIMEAKTRPYNDKTAARLILDLAHALSYAHQQDIVHRDIKPANIMMDGDVPKLTDFGLAHVGGVEVSRLTQSGELLGTLCYMPPEQVGGRENPERYFKPTPQVDVYALGATLYELLVGSLPFDAATPGELVKQIIEDDPPPPYKAAISLNKNLEAICIKCLEKSPAKRYYSASELADDLQRYLNGVAVNAPRINWTIRRWRIALRRRGVVAMILLAAVVVVVGFVSHFYMYWDKLSELQSNYGEVAEGQPEYDRSFLFRALGEDDKDIRLSAILALSRFDDDEARNVVISAASDPKPEVRMKILSVIDKSAPSLAEPICRVLLEDTDPNIVGGALFAAEKLGIDKFWPEIRKLSASPNRTIRRRALPLAMKQVGGDNTRFIQEYFENGPEEGKLEILQRFLESRHPPPVETLIQLPAFLQSSPVAEKIAEVLQFYTNGDFGVDAAQWREWWTNNGSRIDIRRCLVFPWLPLGSPVNTGDVAWTIGGKPIGTPQELAIWKPMPITVVRDDRMVTIAGLQQLPEHQYSYVGTMDDYPAGRNPIAGRIVAALESVQNKGKP